jgi:two-component system, NtrC family, nitrogen regulation sensor histidine kinase NtrY
MSFRFKVMLAFALTVSASVWLVSWLVSESLSRTFAERDQRRASLLVQQFRREFERRGQELLQIVKAVSASQSVQTMLGAADVAPYVHEAEQLAAEQRLNFLEILSKDDTIISSAEWPARFAYKEEWLSQRNWGSLSPFLRIEELQDGSALGLYALRTVQNESNVLTVIGGLRLDDEFLKAIAVPEGMRVALDRKALGHGNLVTEMPLKGPDDQTLATIFIAQSSKELADLQDFIRRTAWIVGGAGVFLGALLSLWASERVTRPVERLASSVRRVAAGEWDTRAVVASHDEIGQLAADFNTMTEQLVDQKRRMLQAERVAAWREIARRLAHELKNPLFPLQITIENLRRVRETKPAEFEEVFEESTRALLVELDQLKSVVNQFSDFAKMPAPRFEAADINEVVRHAIQLFDAQLKGPVRAELSLAANLPRVEADPEQIGRALRNLVLNAMDAMPNGGVITLRTSAVAGAQRVRIEVADTGQGLTQEEVERLFSPYYTTKQHGTGLGLAIVQSVIADHKGTVTVESAPGKGTTFRMELNRYEQTPAGG